MLGCRTYTLEPTEDYLSLRLIFRIAERIGKSLAWCLKNLSCSEVDLWRDHFIYEDDHPDRNQMYIARLVLQVASILNPKADQLKISDFYLKTEYTITEEYAELLKGDMGIDEVEPTHSTKSELTVKEQLSKATWRSVRATAQRKFDRQKQQKPR